MDSLILKQELEKKFELFCRQYGEGIANGDYKKVNKIHKKLHEIHLSVKENKFENFFEQFIRSENENVRLNAATFSLKTNPSLGIEALKELSMLNTITGLTAQTILTLWLKGELILL